MTTIPGLYAIGECNFADHGANRLGANSLLQACVDGYFILPVTIGNYLSGELKTGAIDTNHSAFQKSEAAVKERIAHLFGRKGSVTVDALHRRLGRVMWKECAMSRTRSGLLQAISEIKAIQEDYRDQVSVTGSSSEFNPELDKALRLGDFLGIAELMCMDALAREESCGAHFREEYQTKEGEALRNDDDFCYVSAWEFKGDGKFELHREALDFEYVKMITRDYR